MLSFYIIFMAHHIKPNSVSQYLSGIVSSLEPHFPNIRDIRNGLLVSRTLAGIRKLRGFTGTSRKRALTEDDLNLILTSFNSADLDDLLLVSIVFTGFHGLMHLGELTISDNEAKRSFLKAILRHMVIVTSSTYSFTLPSHKADRFFEGNTVLIESWSLHLSPLHPFINYLATWDARFPLHPHLWLTSASTPPTYLWVVRRLKGTLGQDVAGHSLWSGGATALATTGTPDDHIQAQGHWTSQSYEIYIRKHPIMLQSLLNGRSAFNLHA